MTLTFLRWGVALIPILVDGAPVASPRLADSPSPLALCRRRWARSATPAFNALFYSPRIDTSALNLSIIQGAIPALVLIGARLFLGVRFTALQALGALIDHARRRGDRRSGRSRPGSRRSRSTAAT